MTRGEEHPAVDSRRFCLQRMRRQFPWKCAADREDAVHEALCAAIRLGKAGDRRAVYGRAVRALLGLQRSRGASRSCRSPATSCATEGRTVDGATASPAEWLDGADGHDHVLLVDFEAAVDGFAAVRRARAEAERRERERAEAERARTASTRARIEARRSWAEDRAAVRELVDRAVWATGGVPRLAVALGVRNATVYRWRDLAGPTASPDAKQVRRLQEIAHGAQRAADEPLRAVSGPSGQSVAP